MWKEGGRVRQLTFNFNFMGWMKIDSSQSDVKSVVKDEVYQENKLCISIYAHSSFFISIAKVSLCIMPIRYGHYTK